MGVASGEYDIALEKFLVCSMVIGSIPRTQEQLGQLWSSARDETIAGHILPAKHQAASPRSEMDYLMSANKQLERKLTRIHLIQLTVLIAVAVLFLGITLGLWPNPFLGNCPGNSHQSDNLFPSLFP